MITEQTLFLNTDAITLWQVLTQSEFTKQYMFNCSVSSKWTKDSSIVWEGEFQGYKVFQKGEILEIEENSLLIYSTFDPNHGLEDLKKNYIQITYAILEENNGVSLCIRNETFDRNSERIKHIEQGWKMVYDKLKEVVEAKNKLIS